VNDHARGQAQDREALQAALDAPLTEEDEEDAEAEPAASANGKP
jgi:hypothetical protein